MSYDPVGGYVLFPPTLARVDLIAVTLKAMELGLDEFEVLLPEDGLPLFPSEGFPVLPGGSSEQAVEHLAQEESGVIEGKGTKSSEIYWFEPRAASYPVVTVWVEPRAINYEKRPEKVEHFVERWLQLCEQGQAVFGYFSPFGFMFERDYLEETILPVFQNGTARQFLEEITPSWLIYLGPELAERWRQEQTPLPSPLQISQDLSSGAHFLRASPGVESSSLSVFRPW
ncbi:hypothetical protein ccbrp13_33700 [Ktedonobacteria bacterium brp13]|nr:hypothetical protein ccbrp13_33700 [Ktedonobacteria bacterium brp13]